MSRELLHDRDGPMTSRNRKLAKRARLAVLATMLPLVLLLTSLSRPAVATAKHYTELTFPPLPEVQVPAYDRFQLPNGMVVYLMEDHELPLVGGTALIATGDRLEAAAKVGLAGIVGEVMRSGGTRNHSADELNQLLEQRAAVIETSIGLNAGRASFNALKEDLEPVLGLFAEVLREPAFAPDKLTLAQVQRQGAIARRNDSPGSIASREFRKLLYGETSPYARTEEYTTLSNISRQDVLDFYQQYFHPNRILLGIVGDFDPRQMRSLLEAKFGDWPSNPGPEPEFPLPATALPAVSQANLGGMFLVDQAQLNQSYVQIGQLGGQLNNPDVFPLFVMNGVLNGFGGRLFNQVRSRQGLAYSVYASWNPEFDYPGLFVAGGQTRSETTVAFVRSVLGELERLRTSAISPGELTYAKDSILNSFVFNFQDPAQTLSRLMRYEFFGYPQDFIFRYQRGIKQTTIADVQRVARTYLQPEDMVTLVVGNSTTIQPPLTSLQASVTPLDVTIPQPQS